MKQSAAVVVIALHSIWGKRDVTIAICSYQHQTNPILYTHIHTMKIFFACPFNCFLFILSMVKNSSMYGSWTLEQASGSGRTKNKQYSTHRWWWWWWWWLICQSVSQLVHHFTPDWSIFINYWIEIRLCTLTVWCLHDLPVSADVAASFRNPKKCNLS